MKINNITVNGLFGIFQHEIPLNVDNHITIIHAPNGFGKTILLKMINALFNSRFNELRNIPFEELIVNFDNGGFIKVRREEKNKESKERIESDLSLSQNLIFEFRENLSSKTESDKIEPLNKEKINIPLSIIEREIPELSRIGSETWVNILNSEEYSLDDIFNLFADRLPISIEKGELSENLKNIIKFQDVSIIGTQRLLSFQIRRRNEIAWRESKSATPTPVVVNYSKELTGDIKEKIAEYASLSQSLDRTFPIRLVKESHSSKFTMNELKENLRELEEKRSKLMSAGLLSNKEEVNLKELLDIDEKNRNILSVYIEDVQKKLSIFEELNNKIELLVSIINSRFRYKQMSISQNEGFIFKTSDGKIISADSLSSGEQHELVLFYELLFKVKPHSLILIDEPEISLHVIWQELFLKDLKKVADLIDFDALIATHSPEIISDQWELTVQLEGPKE